MKTIAFKVFILLLLSTQILSCGKEPERILAVNISFDPNVGYVSIIETMKNDTSVHIDTLVYEYLPSKVNGYIFSLEFKQDDSNGDYLITSQSCQKSVVISDVRTNKDYTFSYLFNGVRKTEKDRTVYVTHDMLCD